MITRELELNKLKLYRDKPLIKVITWIRRCGKSTVLELFRQDLLGTGVPAENIISINFEDLANEALLDYQTLHNFVLKNLKDGKNYVFFDEIQMVKNFEKVVNSLFIRENIDLYITGSNADFLSWELATLLTGRYIEIKMYPFSFKEYVSAFEDKSRLDLMFNDYILYWWFPEVVNFLVNKQKTAIMDYLLGIYNTVLNKDIITRFRIADVITFNNITKFLLDNIGGIVSSKKISNYLTQHYDKTSYNTVDKYIEALTSGLIFYEVPRRDIKWKQLLQTLTKYYVADLGFRRAMLGSAGSTDLGYILENVVYFELLRRGNIVHIGKQGDREVDFIAQNPETNATTYYQVSYTVTHKDTLQRELEPLQMLNDNYEKIILTTDIHETNYQGIKQINVINWLLGYGRGLWTIKMPYANDVMPLQGDSQRIEQLWTKI